MHRNWNEGQFHNIHIQFSFNAARTSASPFPCDVVFSGLHSGSLRFIKMCHNSFYLLFNSLHGSTGCFYILKAVIFDMDGTLLDSEGMSAVATDYGFRKILGRGITSEENAQLVGRPVKKVLSQWFPENGDVIYDTGREYYNANLSSIKVYPGVKELLKKLSEMKLEMAVVTSSHRSDAETLLTMFGIRKYFSFYIGQEDTLYQKPDPEPLNLALKKIGTPGGNVLYIGDQPYDIMAAHGANIPVLGALWGSGRRELLEQYHPLALLKKPEEVLQFAIEFDKHKKQ